MFDYFLQRKIKSGFKKYHRDNSFLNYDDIKAILIFFEMEDWHEIQPIIEDLRADGKRVTAWTIKADVPKISFPYYVRVVDTSVEINWMRLLNPEVIAEFERVEYDTLMDFSSSDDDYLLYLLSRNKSRFCIGIIEREYKAYDFIIFREKEGELLELHELFRQLKNYLRQIQES